MVNHRVPVDLVIRLKKSFSNSKKRSVGERMFSKFENIDHRKHIANNPDSWGFRVRSLNVSRNYPELKNVVIKRLHIGGVKNDAFKLHLAVLNERVKKVCFSKRGNEFVMLNPIAYKIGENYVAMAYADHPSLKELKDTLRFSKNPSPEWDEKTIRAKNVLDSQLPTMQKRKLIFNHALYFSKFELYENNVLFLGFDKKRNLPVYVPLFDLF